MEYTYDHAGRVKTQKTWRNFASDTGAALTTWNYPASRGFLLSKQYADASYWIYQYDTLGQVISGKRFWPDGTPVAGQQFEYGFDDLGNRQTAAPVGQAS